MNRTLLLMAVTVATCLTIGCTSDHEEDLLIPVDPTLPVVLKTYNDDIKAIIDSNCTACHASGASASWYPLETYAEVKASAEAGDLYGRMTDSAAPMPPSGLLPVSVSQSIQDWINDGLLEQ